MGWLGAAAIALASAGCGKATKGGADAAPWPDDRAGEGGGGGRGGSGGVDGEGPKSVPPVGLVDDVRRILTEHCAPCHSGRGGVAYGGFGDIYDAEAMAAAGLLVPGDFYSSPLYRRVAAGEMPPGTVTVDPEGQPIMTPGVIDPFDPSHLIGAVSPEDRAVLAEWIGWGGPSLRAAPREPYGGAELRRLMADDVATLPEGERPFYRYVSLASYHGSPSFSAADLDAAANAVSALLNALSPLRGQAVRPVPLLDPAGEPVALRVDLRGYELDAADWARIEGATEVVDRQAFPCAVPFLQAERLLALALSDEHVRADGGVESVYANIVLRRLLERAGVLAPGQLVFEPAGAVDPATAQPLVSAVTLPQLAAALGVDLARDMAEGGGALRLCQPASEATGEGRCVQRDAMPGGPGRGFWWAMSFDAAEGPGWSVDRPVGPSNGGLVPEQAGVERFALSQGVALWPWQNMTLGFAAFDGQLRLRSSAGAYAFGSPYVAGGFAGPATCLSCHAKGPNAAVDVVLPSLEGGGGAFDEAEIAFVSRLFRPQSAADARTQSDVTAIVEAQRGVCVRGCGAPDAVSKGNAGAHALSTRWATLGRVDAAASLFLGEAAFVEVLGSDPELAGLASAFELGGVSQAAFVGAFGALRRAAVAAGGDEAALNFCAVPEGE